MNRIFSRRDLLGSGAALLAVSALPARSRAADACTPDYAGDKKQRDALHYLEQSPTADKACGLCQYFESRGRCGNCRVLECPVNENGTCDSWSKKEG
jgi:hypothetical protein